MATIADVAREAGVARSTVSAVLTGRRFVEPATRARVEAAISRLNFSVNSRARSLATSRTMTIALVVTFHGADFGPALTSYLVGITDAAQSRGFSVLLVADADDANAILRLAREHQVDGFVLLSVVERDHRVEALRSTGLPGVLVGMPDDTGTADAVDLDFAAAGADLVAYLAARGETDATLLTLPREVFGSGATFAVRFRDGAVDAARGLGMRLAVVEIPSNPVAARSAVREVVTVPDRSSAFIVHNDAAIAALPGVLSGLPAAITADIDVVSAHSEELADLYAIPFTRVETRPSAVAERAIEVLVARIDGTRDDPPRRILLAPEITGARTP